MTVSLAKRTPGLLKSRYGRRPSDFGAYPVTMRPEHHVELRESKDEGIALIDQDYMGVIAEFLRKDRGQLQPTEPCPQHDYPCRHAGDPTPIVS